MKIITISGLDGSGKSTQIEMLKTYLESQGKKVFYFHAVQFSIANKILCHRERNEVKRGDLEIASSQTPRNDKSVTKANWLQIQLRKLALGIDLCRFSKLLKKLEHDGYDYLVSDRYFYDSVINIEYLCHPGLDPGSSDNNKVSTLDSCFRRNDITKPDLSIYLQTSPKTIMQREIIPDQGMEYLKRKNELYDAKTSQWNWKVIDGNRDKDVIFEEIKSYV